MEEIKTKMPMNLQFFAETSASGAAEPTEPKPEDPKTDPKQEPESTGSKPTEEELLAQLAEARAEAQKYQNKYNQASTEAAESKKALRAKQTAEEREAEEKAEAQRLADEEREAMRKELNHIKAMAAYKNIPDEKKVEALIEAIDEKDHASIAAFIEDVKAKAVKEAKAEWQKSIPQPNFGTGEYSSMTIAEAMKIPDREQRLRALAQITR